MSHDINFNETKIIPDYITKKSSLEGNLIKLVAKLSGGLIKGERQARSVILFLVLVVLVVSFYVFGSSFGTSPTPDDLNVLPAE